MSARRILVVDDCEADRAALRRAFASVGRSVELSFAPSVGDALTALRGPDDRAALRPHLMLVDLNMPGRSGLDLLAEVKRDERLREIPVFMLSGSHDATDIRAAYIGHASGYLRKPEQVSALRRLAETLSRLCVESLAFSAPER